LPITAVFAQFAWLAILFLGILFLAGDQPFTTTPAQDRLLDLIAALPAVAGFLLGVAAIARGWARTTIQWMCVYLGLMGCASFIVWFGWEFFH